MKYLSGNTYLITNEDIREIFEEYNTAKRKEIKGKIVGSWVTDEGIEVIING